jgi:hypothetical protein
MAEVTSQASQARNQAQRLRKQSRGLRRELVVNRREHADRLLDCARTIVRKQAALTFRTAWSPLEWSPAYREFDDLLEPLPGPQFPVAR